MMKSFSWLLLASLLSATTAHTSRRLAEFEYFGENLNPNIVEFPLKECQGACLKDAHCGYGLGCVKYEGGDNFPCTGSATSGQRFCVKDSEGTDGTNGAQVLSVSVVSSDGDADTETETETENEKNSEGNTAAAVGEPLQSSNAQSASFLLASSLATATVFIGLS